MEGFSLSPSLQSGHFGLWSGCGERVRHTCESHGIPRRRIYSHRRRARQAAARREFEEELGVEGPGPLQSLGEVRQRAGKIVRGYALEGDLDVSNVRSNDVAIEWPPRSGRTTYFPEIDRAAWFTLPHAREKILASQRPFLDRLEMVWKNASRRHRQKVPI